MSDAASLQRDLQSIRDLNQHDIDAVMAGDTKKIVSQWADDFTVIPPAGPVIRGRAANAALVEAAAAQISAIEPLDYVVEFEEIQVAGDYAFEWGSYRGSMRPRSGGPAIRYSGKLMRILQRQPDGAWKMFRTMTTADPAQPPQ